MILIINPYITYHAKIGRYLERTFPKLWDKFLYLRSRVYDLREKRKNILSATRLMKDETLFNLILIETINRCNETCSFCPANRELNLREFHRMDEKLFISILDQLAELDYRGEIRLFGNDEPLMDTRLPRLQKLVMDKLPDATKGLYTNGLLLTPSIFESLIPNLDWIQINNYDDELKLNESTQKIYDLYKNRDFGDKKVTIYMRKRTQMMTNRAGQTNNRSVLSHPFISPCMYVFTQMFVRPEGKVSPCFFDVQGTHTIGDLNKERLIDVWQNNYDYFRTTLLSEGRKNIPLCSKCDSLNCI